MDKDMILFFDIFGNQKPTKQQAIDAYDEYISLQNKGKPIPKDLQAFINYEILRLKMAHTGNDKTLNLYAQGSNERKNNKNNIPNQITAMLAYYLYYIEYPIGGVIERRKKVAEYLSCKKVTDATRTQEYIKQILEKFEKDIPERIKQQGRIEAFEYYLALFEVSSMLHLNEGIFKIYDQFLSSMNHMLEKIAHPKLSPCEIQTLLKNILMSDMSQQKEIHPVIQLHNTQQCFKNIAINLYEERYQCDNDKESERQAKIEYLSSIIFQNYGHYYSAPPTSINEYITLDELNELDKKYAIF